MFHGGILDSVSDFPDNAANLMYDHTKGCIEDEPDMHLDVTDEWNEVGAWQPRRAPKNTEAHAPGFSPRRVLVPNSGGPMTASGTAVSVGLRGRHTNAVLHNHAGWRSPSAPPAFLANPPSSATPNGLGVCSVPNRSGWSASDGRTQFGRNPSPQLPVIPRPAVCKQPENAEIPPSPGGGFASSTYDFSLPHGKSTGTDTIEAIRQCVAQAQNLPAHRMPNSGKWSERIRSSSAGVAERHLRTPR